MVMRKGMLAIVSAAGLVGTLGAQVPTVPAGTRGLADFEAGVRLMREGKAAEAEARFERAVAQDGRVAAYHLWLGNAVGAQAATASTVRQPFLARRVKAEFERAVALDPELLDAREGLIGFYMQAPGFMGGDPAKAREQQREIARRDPYRGHLAASTLAAFARDTAGVERALRAAITTAPDSVRAVITLAQRQQSWRRVDAAFATLEQALARRPGDIALRFQVGRLAASEGQRLELGERMLAGLLAERDWEPSNLRPSRAAVHYRLGMVLEKAGRTAEARANYERAVTLDPQLKAAKDALAALTRRA